MMKESKKKLNYGLKRDLEEHYLVLYIDATFVHTRRDDSVKKEGYFTIFRY
ncbi:hypothetical protein C6N29_03120 [Flavobacterium columnare]|nr:hypothetical protein C6N29_03120 [Flavobacterium columnare]